MTEQANIKNEPANERNPDDMPWPKSLPDKVVINHGKELHAGKHFRRYTESAYPHSAPCPCCGKKCQVERTISEVFYSTDSQKPAISWESCRTYHCPTCGDKQRESQNGVVWIIKPSDYDIWSASSPEPHDDERTPVKVAYSPATDPDNDEDEIRGPV